MSWGAFEREINPEDLLEMSAGYIQLAAVGQQDAYLTGSPQVTYFSGVYKRHTPFVLEAYDIPFQNQQVTYGQNNICRIPPKGDLIRGLTLKVDLPPLFDPGTFWAWNIEASAANHPKIIINGAFFDISYQGITFYSTYNQSSWIQSNLASFVSYSNATNQFIFSNCSTLEVDQNGGIFWGLDPKAGMVSPTNSSNLVYTVGTGNSNSNAFANSAATSNFAANYISSVVSTRASDFTLQQAGWVQSTGLPRVNTRTSLFLSTQGYTITSTSQYINFYNWTNQDTVATYAVTTNGRIKFTNTGFYIVRAGFSLGTGSVLNISYGSDTQENIYFNGIPVTPQFEYSCDFRVSPDPSMPLLMPIHVRNTANTYYFYAQTTSAVTQFTSGTYLTITPVDDLYVFNTNTPVTSNIVPLYGNVATPQNTTVTLDTDHSMTFSSLGTWLLSGVIYLDQTSTSYVANVSVWNPSSSTPDYAYTTMSTQGRDPTIAFSMPIVVTSTTQKYYTNIYSTSAMTVLSTSYYSITQIGAQTYTGYETVLSNNGILLNPSTQVQTLDSNTPFNFDTNFNTPTGTNSQIISINPATGNLQFSNIATYMLTAVISSSDNVRSITFGTNTYEFDIGGLFPQITVSVPYRVTQPGVDVPIKVTTDQLGSTTNIFSNTYISVYPVASNVIPTVSYNYYDSVGTWLVNRADLVIGGQTVQTLTGEFIEIYNDIYVPYENQSGLKLLIGKYDTETQVYPPGRTYFVNLPFYFYGNPGLYLPLVALERQDVEVHITFRNLQELTAIDTSSITTPLTATVITEYVYLAEPEINWFKRSKIEYTIQQCQYQSYSLASQFKSAIFNLDFINPIRELFFIVQLDGTLPYEYSDLNSLAMNFNASEAFTSDVTDTLYLNSIQPFDHYPNYPTRNFYMYSFTTIANTPKPHGQVNFSRIRDVFIQLNTNAYDSPKEFRVIGINYNILTIQDGIAGVMFNSNDF